jgi:hypothetical protein
MLTTYKLYKRPSRLVLGADNFDYDADVAGGAENLWRGVRDEHKTFEDALNEVVRIVENGFFSEGYDWKIVRELSEFRQCHTFGCCVCSDDGVGASPLGCVVEVLYRVKETLIAKRIDGVRSTDRRAREIKPWSAHALIEWEKGVLWLGDPGCISSYRT